MTNTHQNFTDFLKDRQFIQWQLLPDESLNTYWHDFMQKNPLLIEEIEKAATYLKTVVRRNSLLTDTEILQLLNQIETSIEDRSKRKRVYRLIRYTAIAACAAIAVVLGINLLQPNWRLDAPNTANDQIVGNLLNHENIQFITGNNTHTFNENIEVQITENGDAKIIDNGEFVQTVCMQKDLLNKLIVPYGKRLNILLSDGSHVWLNSGSVLEFPAQFSSKERTVYLTMGEMYIEVAKEAKRQFLVHTSKFDVKVYGTKFNLSTYKDVPQSVVLVEGSIGLKASEADKEHILAPNEQAIYTDNGAFEMHNVDVESFIAWKDGYLTFDKTPMKDVLKQIERYYNLSFSYEQDVNLQKRTCSGKVYLSENLDNVMHAIGLLTSTKYQKKNNQVYIIHND